jgi:hypothetical protein
MHLAQAQEADTSETKPGTRKQLKKNCAKGNQVACNELEGTPGFGVKVPGESPLLPTRPNTGDNP